MNKQIIGRACTNKTDNLEEMDKFLGRFNLLTPNQKELENVNRPITSTEIGTVIMEGRQDGRVDSGGHLLLQKHLKYIYQCNNSHKTSTELQQRISDFGKNKKTST